MAANTKIYFRWSVILVVAVLIFVFFAFYAPQFTEAALTLDMAGNKVSVQTTKVSREEVQGLDCWARARLPALQSRPWRCELGPRGRLAYDCAQR